MRNQFITPASKGRVISMSVSPQSPSPNFTHSVIQRQPPTPQTQQQQTQRQCQQRLNHSPFSPQSQQPSSPLDLFPESPVQQNASSTDSFGRTESLQDNNYILQNSPQTPRPHGQSPNHTTNRSPAYVGQVNQSSQINTQNSSIRVHLESGGYAQAPGTPRPQQFGSGPSRPTVYARPGDLFGGTIQTSPFTSPRSDNNSYPATNQEGNRQLRDLLQRQQMGAPNSSSSMQSTQNSSQNNQTPPLFLDEQNVQQNIQPQQNLQNLDSITFRQPLPPGMISSRPQRLQMQNPNIGGKIVRPGQQINQAAGSNQQQIQNPRGMMSSDLRQRIIRPIVNNNILMSDKTNSPSIQQPSTVNIVQQQQQQQLNNNQKLSVSVNRINQTNVNDNNYVNLGQNSQLIQQQQTETNVTILTQRLSRPHNITQLQQISNVSNINDNINNSTNSNNLAASVDQQSNSISDSAEIPDSVTAELENLEQDESVVMGEVEGVGDILGGLGDDDDDLLVSLTSDLDADFNLLEYADPELDSTDDVKTNLLDSLELDENDIEKEDKIKLVAPEQDIKPNNDNNNQMTDPRRGIVTVSSNQTMSNQHNVQQSNTVMKAQQLQQNPQNITRNNTQPPNQQVILQQIQNPSIHHHQQITQHQQQITQHQQQITQHQQQICNQQTPQLPNQQQQQLLQQQVQLNRLKNIQQIQQQMMQQVEQAAATGEPMQIGTHLVSKDGAIGIVTANNKVSVSYPNIFNRTGYVKSFRRDLLDKYYSSLFHRQTQGAPQRIQQFRMANPNCPIQGVQTQQPRMMLQQIQANRLVNINPVNNVQSQSPHQQQVQQGGPQQQQQAPPPYPEPPPPYPGIGGNVGPPQSSQVIIILVLEMIIDYI